MPITIIEYSAGGQSSGRAANHDRTPKQKPRGTASNRTRTRPRRAGGCEISLGGSGTKPHATSVL